MTKFICLFSNSTISYFKIIVIQLKQNLLLSIPSSNRWVSKLHRVVAKLNQPGRLSLAFFHQPDWDAKITPIFNKMPEKSIKSGPYLMKKFLSTTN